MGNTVIRRNIGIDALKYICAFLVICIHSKFPGDTILRPFTRIAVPIFFMITGYFYTYIKEKGRERNQLLKTLKLFVVGNLLYFAISLATQILKGQGIQAYFQRFLDLKTWIKFLFFNESPFKGHLWYLGALVYVLLIVYMADMKFGRKKMYILIPILLTINIIFGNYSAPIFQMTLLLICTRNFLFLGLPFFLLGDYLYQNGSKLSNKSLIAGIIISGIGTYVENGLLLNLDTNVNLDLFVSTIPLSYFIFVFVIKNEHRLSNGFIDFIAKMGKEHSAHIYILHLAVITVVSKLVRIAGAHVSIVSVIYSYSVPVIILIVSTGVSYVLNRLKSSKLFLKNKALNNT